MNDHNPYEPPDGLPEEKRDRNTAIIGLVSTVAVVVLALLLAIAGAASFLLFSADAVEEPAIVPADKKESK